MKNPRNNGGVYKKDDGYTHRPGGGLGRSDEGPTFARQGGGVAKKETGALKRDRPVEDSSGFEIRIGGGIARKADGAKFSANQGKNEHTGHGLKVRQPDTLSSGQGDVALVNQLAPQGDE